MSTTDTGAGAVIIFAILYFIPAIFALARGHHNGAAILMTNLFLGWTFLGWVIALIWASTAVQRPGKSRRGSDDTRTAQSPLDGGATFVEVVGESFENDDGSSRQAIIQRLRAGDAVELRLEPDNRFDRRAIAVHSARGQIGYISRDDRWLFDAVKAGKVGEVIVDSCGPNAEGVWGVSLEIRRKAPGFMEGFLG